MLKGLLIWTYVLMVSCDFYCSIRSRVRGQLWIYLAFIPSEDEEEDENVTEQTPSAPDEVSTGSTVNVQKFRTLLFSSQIKWW